MPKGITALLWLAAVMPASSQSPTFDAASVKVSNVGNNSSTWHSRTGYLVMKNQTLQRLVMIAYGFNDEQRVLGGPSWATSDRFDVEARAAGPSNNPELLLMLQKLLAERFQLAIHRDTRNGSGFAIVPIKGGIRIKPDETEAKPRSNSHRGRIEAQRISMAKLAETLSPMLNSRVIDETGAKGLYSFTLEWVPDSANRTEPDAVPVANLGGPSLDYVLAHQLGVQLENRKLPVDLIVIDKAEKPTEN